MTDVTDGTSRNVPTIDLTDGDQPDEVDIKQSGETIKQMSNEPCLEVSIRRDCPYLETIDRKALDFDFEKLCSISLSKVNVYACLVCGKYFQGRGRSTHAFSHSVNESHHIYLNLETLKFYSLPDDFEVVDPSLNDILHVLRPRFTREDIDKLNHKTEPAQAHDGKQYYPGIVGLNNLKYNDYCNVVFQALSHVIPLRDYFLLEPSSQLTRSKSKGQPVGGVGNIEQQDQRHMLRQRFGELLRKLWNPRNFKAHVSPHEMLQAIVLSSGKKFEFTKQSDPIVFLGWFLNSLLGSSKRSDGGGPSGATIIKRTLQGKIRVATRLLLVDPIAMSMAAPGDEPKLVPARNETFELTSFLYLTLDLPAMPLFPKKDEKGKVLKPRVSIGDLLAKFNGSSEHEHRAYKETSIKRYELLRLPKYLILYFRRFTRNTFFTEKNTHLVDFPIGALDMTHLLSREAEALLAAEAEQRRQQQHQRLFKRPRRGDNETSSRKDENEQAKEEEEKAAAAEPPLPPTDGPAAQAGQLGVERAPAAKPCNYSLVANIVHDGQPDSGKGTYRAHILHRPTGKWFELQDLYVTELVDTTLITLSEPYIQIWELKE